MGARNEVNTRRDMLCLLCPLPACDETNAGCLVRQDREREHRARKTAVAARPQIPAPEGKVHRAEEVLG